MNQRRALDGFARVALAAAVVVSAGCSVNLERAQQNDYRKIAQDESLKLYPQEQEVLDETNALRKAQGLPALELDARLVLVARSRSQDMARRSYFGHVTPEGQDVFQILRHEKMNFQAAGENLARNNYALDRTAQMAMQGWEKSPGHRANLLHPAFGHIGVGVAVAKDGKKYFTQIFTD